MRFVRPDLAERDALQATNLPTLFTPTHRVKSDQLAGQSLSRCAICGSEGAAPLDACLSSIPRVSSQRSRVPQPSESGSEASERRLVTDGCSSRDREAATCHPRLTFAGEHPRGTVLFVLSVRAIPLREVPLDLGDKLEVKIQQAAQESDHEQQVLASVGERLGPLL